MFWPIFSPPHRASNGKALHIPPIHIRGMWIGFTWLQNLMGLIVE